MKAMLTLAFLLALAALSYWTLGDRAAPTADSEGRSLTTNEIPSTLESATLPPVGRQPVQDRATTDIEEPVEVTAAVPEETSASEEPQTPKSSYAIEYEGWSAEQLKAEQSRMQHLFLQERARIFDELREARVVTETTLSPSGAVPKPPESFEHGMYSTVVNPSEATHHPGQPATVWFVHAARDSYPELYALRDRVRWLKQQ